MTRFTWKNTMVVKTLKLENLEQNAISENLQRLFMNKKVTETEVAHSLNVPVMTIRRLLSGETTDPRIFTLKTLADYFNVSLDSLVNDKKLSIAELTRKNKPIFIPVLDWGTAEKIKSIKDIDLAQWQNWHPISLAENISVSEYAFAIESRPSMYPRFQKGTIFIIDPDIDPGDGDIVLVRIKNNNELTLRELTIDPPEWQLHSVVSGSMALQYSSENLEIVGVAILTLLYNRKIYG